jgi:PAT family beta-lactamase induction signal transducer AmpG
MATMRPKLSFPGKKAANPYLWSFTTYFTEGFPYTIIRTISSVFFRDRGMSLESIGLTSLFGLPWILKFLWGPLVDEFGTKRKWLLITQGLLVGLILATAIIAPLTSAPMIIAFLFFFGSFIAATHDVAIDGFYLEALDKSGQAKFLGYRVMAYRIAMMTGTGVIVTIGTTKGWGWAFLSAAVIMALFFLYHLAALPRCEQEKNPLRQLLAAIPHGRFLGVVVLAAIIVVALRAAISSPLYNALLSASPILKKITFPAWIGLLLFGSLLLIGANRKRIKGMITRNPASFYARAFYTFMDRKEIGSIIAFIILVRTGEFMLSAMASPFLVDLGIKIHYGWISATIGLPASILGAMIGGWLISRHSLKKMIWPFLLAQNLTNIVYMFLALHLNDLVRINTGNPSPLAIGAKNMLAVVLVHGFDQFSGGLGTAVLMTFLMRICLSGYKAAHYAIGTGLMSVSGLYAGVMSGFLASWTGYGYFFGISFLLSIPGMIMIFFIPHFEE